MPSLMSEKLLLGCQNQCKTYSYMTCMCAECLSEAGAYYGSDCPPTTHSNASSPEACCKLCQSTAECAIWNW